MEGKQIFFHPRLKGLGEDKMYKAFSQRLRHIYLRDVTCRSVQGTVIQEWELKTSKQAKDGVKPSSVC